MSTLLSLEEAASILSLSPSALRGKLNRGVIQGVKVEKGQRSVWMVSLDTVASINHEKSRRGYTGLYQKWLADQASGFLTGRPVSQVTIDNREYGMQRFWALLKQKASLEAVSVENFRLAMAALPVDYEQKNCFYGQRDQIYKAVYSFIKFLVQENIRPKQELELLAAVKPRRVMPAKRKVLRSENAIQTLIETNEYWTDARSELDLQLTKTILYLLLFAGLRRKEACDLLVSDIDFDLNVLYVRCGKGNKPGVVGLWPELRTQLEVWLTKYRPSYAQGEHVLINNHGKAIDGRALHRKIERLSQKAEIPVTPHGLRHSCATYLLSIGMPLTHVQRTLRHASAVTTSKIYDQNDEWAAAAWMANAGQAVGKTSSKPSAMAPKKRRVIRRKRTVKQS